MALASPMWGRVIEPLPPRDAARSDELAPQLWAESERMLEWIHSFVQTPSGTRSRPQVSPTDRSVLDASPADA